MLGTKRIQWSLILSFVKRILKYIKGTQNFGFWYDRHSTIDLVGFTDADLVGFTDADKYVT
jgi:hypothetical protein